MLCEVRSAQPRTGLPVDLELFFRFCGLPPRLKLAGDQIKQRQVTLGQVRRLGRPVVHLHIDVDMVVRRPRRRVRFVPQPLQVGRQPRPPRRAHQQVAAVLKEHRLQLRIDAALGIRRQPLIRRQRADLGRRRPQVQRHPAEHRAIVRHMPGLQFLKALRRCRRDLPADLRRRIIPVILPRRIHHIIRRRRQHHHDLIASLQAGSPNLRTPPSRPWR